MKFPLRALAIPVTLFSLALPVSPNRTAAQQIDLFHYSPTTAELTVASFRGTAASHGLFLLDSKSSPSLIVERPQLDLLQWNRPVVATSPGMIEKMETAFYCNDTPFIDQVRLPMAALWRGHIRLTVVESDVTTANFVMGLPGGGALHSLSLTGSGYVAVHAPPSDQLVGLHMTFYPRGSPAQPRENSGWHGLEYAFRAGKSFFRPTSAQP